MTNYQKIEQIDYEMGLLSCKYQTLKTLFEKLTGKSLEEELKIFEEKKNGKKIASSQEENLNPITSHPSGRRSFNNE